jgi:uncharacterized 2Fe-2S/4Fe-4S cluster protein (DUF4445 family)
MPSKSTVRYGAQSWEIVSTLTGLTLLDQLQHEQVPIKSSCMGKGICRQCRVQVLKGVAPVSNADRKSFNEEQLKQGWRLSCSLRPRTNLEVLLPQIFIFDDTIVKIREPLGSWWFACDLGTTGIEISANDQMGSWCTIKSVNRQVSMGADVMTRLEYAQRNGVKPLYDRLAQQLKSMLGKINQQNTTSFIGSKTLWVAGNSALTAFIAQQPIESLATAPYQPESLEGQTFAMDSYEVRTLPLLHSFVGGDLFAGLFLMWQRGLVREQPWIFMDVGTNSEILFWDCERLFVSSTPAGPAFEGSSISIGMRAENGAIIHPRWKNGRWQFSVIGNDVVKGICGSALIEAISESLAAQIIKDDGEVVQPECLMMTGQLGLSQDDVREFQLAKSAIQTGLEVVQKKSALVPEHLYLAGAFGENLDLPACQAVGLLPKIPTTALGNTSLIGTELWAQTKDVERAAFQDWLNEVLTPIELAMAADFQEAFIQNMSLKSQD